MSKVIGKQDSKLKTTLYNALGYIFTRHKDISITKNTYKTIIYGKVYSPLKHFKELQALNSLTDGR